MAAALNCHAHASAFATRLVAPAMRFGGGGGAAGGCVTSLLRQVLTPLAAAPHVLKHSHFVTLCRQPLGPLPARFVNWGRQNTQSLQAVLAVAPLKKGKHWEMCEILFVLSLIHI